MNNLSDKKFDEFIAKHRIPREERKVQVVFPAKRKNFNYSMAAAILLFVINTFLLTSSMNDSYDQVTDETASYEYLENPVTYTLQDNF